MLSTSSLAKALTVRMLPKDSVPMLLSSALVFWYVTANESRKVALMRVIKI